MENYITGTLIKNLREKNKLTQQELADKLFISAKAVSKWETGKGLPDISMLEPIGKIFNISITELLTGQVAINSNVNANMLRSVFYVCPICGNVIHAMGQAHISCHGINLVALEADSVNVEDKVSIESIEDELFVKVDHPMTKKNYISFIAAVSYDKIQLVKLYPEGSPQARFKRNRVSYIYFYDNVEGLFLVDLTKF